VGGKRKIVDTNSQWLYGIDGSQVTASTGRGEKGSGQLEPKTEQVAEPEPKTEQVTELEPKAEQVAEQPKAPKKRKRRTVPGKKGEKHAYQDPLETLSREISVELYWILINRAGLTELEAMIDIRTEPYKCSFGTMKLVDKLIEMRSASDKNIATLIERKDAPSVIQMRKLRQSLRTEVKRARQELHSKWFINFLGKADCYAQIPIEYEVFTPNSVLTFQRDAGAAFWRGEKNRHLVDSVGKIVTRPKSTSEADKSRAQS
jgi:hypothetical protein